LLTSKYLGGVPDDARVQRSGSFRREFLESGTLERVRALNEIAVRRGQSLAQMALAWTLRDPRVTTALIGVSRLEQLEENVAALDHLEFTSDELAEIDVHATDAGIDIWEQSRLA
jgi:L-glyceraldehyde 3-phosphate reductase